MQGLENEEDSKEPGVDEVEEHYNNIAEESGIAVKELDKIEFKDEKVSKGKELLINAYATRVSSISAAFDIDRSQEEALELIDESNEYFNKFISLRESI